MADIIPRPHQLGLVPPEPRLGLLDAVRGFDPRRISPHVADALARLAQAGPAAMEFFTPAGDVVDMQQGGQMAVEAARNLNPLGVLGGLGVAGLGLAGMAVPGRPGQAAEVALSQRVGYNPPSLPQRPFHDDYPGVSQGRDGERLAQSIDGVPLEASAVVAGRREVGGPDRPLDNALFERAFSQLVDDLRPRTKREMKGAFGRTYEKPDRANDRTLRVVEYLKTLSPEQKAVVLQHEFGHVIDDMRAGIEITANMQDELARVYHDVVGGGRRVLPKDRAKPENYSYKGDDIRAEYIAEAIRAYMVDPNYLKSVAPKTAKAIREYVNNNHRLKHVIQFNEVAALLAGAAASAAALSMGTEGDDRL